MSAEPYFDGETYDHGRDGERLATQLQRVLAFMFDHEAHFLHEIAAAVQAPEASVSARIRDLKKARFGGYKFEIKYVERGLWSYRLLGDAAASPDVRLPEARSAQPELW